MEMPPTTEGILGDDFGSLHSAQCGADEKIKIQKKSPLAGIKCNGRRKIKIGRRCIYRSDGKEVGERGRRETADADELGMGGYGRGDSDGRRKFKMECRGTVARAKGSVATLGRGATADEPSAVRGGGPAWPGCRTHSWYGQAGTGRQVDRGVWAVSSLADSTLLTTKGESYTREPNQNTCYCNVCRNLTRTGRLVFFSSSWIA